ncbi:tetratricopeptide repeat protein [Streptomyces sp. YS-B37]|uniref:tetratricopeptide repeat protein n=1 Tax=Streptomyces sp. YS-B37 TaxID=3407669 RepID=UPI003B5093DB
MDEEELEWLVGEGAELLLAGWGSADRAAVRDDFIDWFMRRGLSDCAENIGDLFQSAEPPVHQDLTGPWHRQLRAGIRQSLNPEAAADELRALIDRWSQTRSSSPTGGDHVDFRRSTFNGQVVGVQHVRNTYGAAPLGGTHPGPLDWPLAKDVEPLTHGVRPTGRVKGLPALPPYVGRDQDGMVNSALEQARSESGLVIVLGQAYVGKSRTALAAMAQVVPEYRVFAPAQHEDLRKLPALLRGCGERCVVWLDDLDGHLGDRGLEPRLLAQLTGLEAVVLATMREDVYDTYVRTSAPGRLLDLATTVELPVAWEAAELKRAEETEDPRLVVAARESGTTGVPAYLTIGHRFWNDWQRDRNPGRHPRAHALLRAALDLARCGLKGPLPQHLLVTVHEGYGIAGLERESLDDAFEWAGREQYGVLRMLNRSGLKKAPCWEVLPYFVHTAEQDEGFPPVAGWVWGQAVEAARANPSAYDVESVIAGARAGCQREAEAGDASAMNALGLLEESLGEGETAESWFRQAAEAGWTESAGRLGRLLVERGEIREAEPFLESAAEAGDDEAATLLGKLLRDRAAKWFRVAKEVGSPEAAHQLGDLLLSAGDFDEANDCYLVAERYGYVEGARSSGIFHLLVNSREIALVWLTRAAEAGDALAVEMLADMESEPQSLEDARDYFSASDAYPLDNTHHGVVVEKLGRLDEARKDYEKGYEVGDAYAAYRLAALLEKQGNAEEAKLWYRKAADMGHPIPPDTVKE